MIDFRHLLQKPVDEAKKPKPLPAGTYTGKIEKFEMDESREKKTPLVRLILIPLAAGDGIDPSQLDGIDLSKRRLRREYYLTDEAMWRYSEFMKSCCDTRGRTYHECMPELPGTTVLMDVTVRPSQGGKEFYNDVSTVLGPREVDAD